MKCRHCGGADFIPFADLGRSPPSNAYLAAADAPERSYPLRVAACRECWLVQTEDFVDREAMFSAGYAYASSVSRSWLAHAAGYVEAVTARFGLNAGSRVVEIAANDGYLLQYVAAKGIPCYGVEPTSSTAALARARGIGIVEAFFGAELGRQLAAAGRGADLVVANNVLAHVPDINDFTAGIAAILRDGGVATFEFPHLLRLVTLRQFDTIYHEHYSYLSFVTVCRILARQGLAVFDVEELETHGGSLRVYAQRASGHHAIRSAVAKLQAAEIAAGIETDAFYRSFQAKADAARDALLGFLRAAKARGEPVAAYGAAAKGNTLLNYAGVGRDLVSYVADLNPAKVGKFLPGSRIPVVSEQHLRAGQPRWVLILPWNLRNEIMTQLSYVRDWGGGFVVAVPELETL